MIAFGVFILALTTENILYALYKIRLFFFKVLANGIVENRGRCSVHRQKANFWLEMILVRNDALLSLEADDVHDS